MKSILGRLFPRTGARTQMEGGGALGGGGIEMRPEGRPGFQQVALCRRLCQEEGTGSRRSGGGKGRGCSRKAWSGLARPWSRTQKGVGGGPSCGVCQHRGAPGWGWEGFTQLCPGAV